MKQTFLKSILLTLAVGIAIPASAATVYLKDGSLVRGTVVGATARDLRIHTPDGDLTIAAERIQRVDYNDNETPPAAAPAPTTDQIETVPAPPEVRRYRRRPPETSVENLPNLFSLEFGLNAPLSEINLEDAGGGHETNGNPGLLIGTQYFYQLDPRWSTGFNIEFLNRSATSSNVLPFGDTEISGNTLMLLGEAKMSIIKTGPVRPYLLAGIGTNRTSTIIDVTPFEGSAWTDTNTSETRRLVSDARWGPAGTLRVGFDFHANEPTVFSLELGWNHISNRPNAATQSGKIMGLDTVTGQLDAFTVSGRWGWRF